MTPSIDDPNNFRAALYRERSNSRPELPATELILCGKCREYYDMAKTNLCPECCKPVSRNIDLALKQVMINMQEFFKKEDDVWSRR